MPNVMINDQLVWFPTWTAAEAQLRAVTTHPFGWYETRIALFAEEERIRRAVLPQDVTQEVLEPENQIGFTEDTNMVRKKKPVVDYEATLVALFGSKIANAIIKEIS